MRKTLSIWFGLALLMWVAGSIVGCKNELVSHDESLSLQFSVDTLSFDTVFSGIGTSTQRVMLHNNHDHALVIERIWLDSARYFQVNIDGENELDRLSQTQLRGGDSLYIFVRVKVNTDEANPIRIFDALHVRVNGNTSTLQLEAIGQNVHLIRSDKGRTVFTSPMTFLADKPYLIYDTVDCGSNLTFKPGATLYMHSGAALVAYGSVHAEGTVSQPVRVLGDRRDYLFENVPYSYAAGQWGGIYLFQSKDALLNNKYSLKHMEIVSGNIGIYAYSDKTSNLPTLQVDGCRIHNHAVYGMIAVGMNTIISNTEISNAASYCLYMEGGEHSLYHTTVASYFNSTDIRIQSTNRKDVAAIYVNNLNKNYPFTTLHLYNSIVTGLRTPELRLATPLEQYYGGHIVGNYIKADSLHISGAGNNVYAGAEDKVFRNTFYEYEVYDYYDFRLDSLSPAIGIADSAIAAKFPTDRRGVARPAGQADAGCYQSQK